MSQQLPAHQVIAHNTAADTENRVHDDAVAARLGFRGGLVPGVDVYAHLCRPAIECWGASFCGPSRVELRLWQPVYENDIVDILAEVDNAGALRAEARTGEGRCATIDVSRSATPPQLPSRGADDQPAPPASERPPASPQTLAAGTTLGSLAACCTAPDLAAYLADLRDEANPLIGLDLVPPAWLLRHANHLLSRNVVLGPWIHVGSVIHHHRPVQLGEELTVTGQVRRNYEHRGHRFVAIDGNVRDRDGETCASVEHTAIYEPRQLRELSRNDQG